MQFNITTMLFNLLQAAIDTTAIAPATPVAQEHTFSLIEMAIKGGWLMLVLLLLSITAIYIFGNKWWMIRKAGQIDKNFMKDIHDLIHDGKIKSAIALCQRYDSPVARLVEKGIERIGRPLQDIQTAVENMGNVEVGRLEKGLPMLATIAGGAPMIGFLGTVTGMIRAFFEMANAGNNIPCWWQIWPPSPCRILPSLCIRVCFPSWWCWAWSWPCRD